MRPAPGAAMAALRRWLHSEAEAYRRGQQRPLGGYAMLLGVYAGGTAVAAAGVLAARRTLPERVPVRDMVTMALASHKLARIITKDPVTSPLRVPFTAFDGASAPGELSDRVRGDGFRHAAGELMTCPMCMTQWVATAFTVGLVTAPRVTRLAMATFAAVAGSDFLQHFYVWLQENS